jgi:hypothetical protein
MAVSRCEITGQEYWKVYRKWGNEKAQRYFRVDKPNERESLKKAQTEDQSLRSRQRAYLSRKVFDLDYHIQSDGKLRGVRRVTVIREGRKPAECFQVRVKLPWEDRPDFTSVSIEKRGVLEAFNQVVEWYCDVYGFDKRSEMRPALRECVDAYMTKLKLKALPETVTEQEDDGDDWVSKIEKEIAQYKTRDRKMINGR